MLTAYFVSKAKPLPPFAFNNYYINLLRIDYFWLHFGHIGDRFWKHISWNLTEHISLTIPYYHIAQVGTLVIVTFCILIMKKKMKINLTLLLIILLFACLQIAYLCLLTITHEPQIGDYGIDRKIWVPIEEARYYNYLTVLIFWMLYGAMFKYAKAYFYIFTLFILISTIPNLNPRKSRFPILIQKYNILSKNIYAKNNILNDNTNETKHLLTRIIGYSIND
jgi:hypothetical protein